MSKIRKHQYKEVNIEVKAGKPKTKKPYSRDCRRSVAKQLEEEDQYVKLNVDTDSGERE